MESIKNENTKQKDSFSTTIERLQDQINNLKWVWVELRTLITGHELPLIFSICLKSNFSKLLEDRQASRSQHSQHTPREVKRSFSIWLTVRVRYLECSGMFENYFLIFIQSMKRRHLPDKLASPAITELDMVGPIQPNRVPIRKRSSKGHPRVI